MKGSVQVKPAYPVQVTWENGSGVFQSRSEAPDLHVQCHLACRSLEDSRRLGEWLRALSLLALFRLRCILSRRSS